MNAAPVWLLDIDGVLNAVSTDPDGGTWPPDQWIRTAAICAGVEWPLLAARPVLDFVRRVHAEHRAEIRWHTTWQHDAADVARALDLPDFPVQPASGHDDQLVGGAAPTGERWWKLAAAERVIGVEGRPLVWTDDDADLQLHRCGLSQFGSPDTALIVCPRMENGLSAPDLRRIEAFLDRMADRREARNAPAGPRRRPAGISP